MSRARSLATTLAGLALLAGLAGLAGTSACRTRSSLSRTGTVDPDLGRFPHVRHAELPCTECHALGAVLRGEPAVPGANDHAPCDRQACHAPEFLAAPGPLCTVCHESVDPTRPDASPLAPYPPQKGQRALASLFSHRKHLDYELMERQVGFHVGCNDCHVPDTRGMLTQPDHAVCGRCHAPEAAPAQAPSIQRCGLCHRQHAKRPIRQNRFIVGDLHFRHDNHQLDRKSELIRCVECHVDSPEAESVVDHPTPTTRVCVTCHDDPERTPPAMSMRVCETCHFTRTRTFRALAPRSHLPELERPEDHTLAFRRDHGADARQNPGRCARCHSFMSGSPRDVCDECHQVMPPQDHVISWREYDHGAAASARADRCSTCHTGRYCTACHSQPPRSHFPLAYFRSGGHALPAQVNIRACMTCHDLEATCTGPGCHELRGLR